MKRILSLHSLKLLFLPRMLGGSLGLGGGLYVLVKLQSSIGMSRELVVIAVVMVLIVNALVIKDCLMWRRLKKVAADDHFLYVSDYADSEQVVIPVSDIVRVTQRHGRTLRAVTVYLRSPSKFGGRIQFQPALERGEWGWAWQENRVVHELRRLANIQTERLR
jgi:hypothetical protein